MLAVAIHMDNLSSIRHPALTRRGPAVTYERWMAHSAWMTGKTPHDSRVRRLSFFLCAAGSPLSVQQPVDAQPTSGSWQPPGSVLSASRLASHAALVASPRPMRAPTLRLPDAASNQRLLVKLTGV